MPVTPARLTITEMIVNGVTARPLPGAVTDLDDRPRLSESGPDGHCTRGQVCLMNNFREGDAPTCIVPVRYRSESDCRLGQQCDPLTLSSREELRVCQAQPAPEVDP